VLGDGGIYSSLVDYGKWDQALYGNTLVSQGTLDGMWTPSCGYGYGWRIDQFAGLRRLHHEGFSCGFRNHVMHFPDERLTVLVLTNRREPAVQPIADFLARLYLT
jgi:CubicO group peptidase (beta-lactamase class C family)